MQVWTDCHILYELTSDSFEVFTAVTMQNAVFWDVPLCGSYKNRYSEERIASIIKEKESAS
jgi:hypothetical protein